jgi:DNA-binding FrmR family transcriptional regulator
LNQYNTKIINRLKRIEGQVKGIQRMMDEGRGCKEVISQLSAIRSATDKLILNIVADNLESCILEDLDKGNNIKDTMEEAIELLLKSR